MFLQNGFTQTHLVPSTPLKHQKYTAQYRSFASTSFLEAAAWRLGHDIPELSSFFFVYYNYLENAEDYLINHGKSHFNSGDLIFSVLEIFEKYGAVPESIYDGQLATVKTKKEVLDRMTAENEMNTLIKSSLDATIKSGSFNQKKAIGIVTDILNNYLDEVPKEYADNHLPLKADDYIELASFNHLPFGQAVVLDISANWRNKAYYNLPLKRFINTSDAAIKNGHTLAWDGDIGAKEDFRNNGYVTIKGEYETLAQITQKERQSAFE
ncbi:hypothetical protein [Croceitalea sp. MTPC5]|uniref:hypothetical protein n=1 Tax=Croceitalea sp. MTPC5 TaxID=3056565 RepID=UPI0030CD59BB